MEDFLCQNSSVVPGSGRNTSAPLDLLDMNMDATPQPAKSSWDLLSNLLDEIPTYKATVTPAPSAVDVMRYLS